MAIRKGNKQNLAGGVNDDPLKHHASKFFCGTMVIGAIVTAAGALCAMYIHLTPIYIRAENSSINEKLDRLSEKLDLISNKQPQPQERK